MSRESASVRLAHVDALRGIAALLVAWTHFSERLRPVAKPLTNPWTWLSVLPEWCNLGRVGVALFFGISGFVIYGSLEKAGPHPGRRFAVNRFFRLYPAYWVSLLVGSLLLWPLAGKPVDWSMAWANVTMFPSLFGQMRVRDLYWTLETELIFYVLCWTLYCCGLMRHAALLPCLIGASLVCWPYMHLHGRAESTLTYWIYQSRFLAIMFWGALVGRAYDETAGFRAGVRGNFKVWQIAILACLMIGVFAPGAVAYLAHGFRVRDSPGFTPPPTSIAYLIALPVFWGWVALVRMTDKALLPWLGTVSYSIYLFHPLALRILLQVIPTRLLPETSFWIFLLLALAGAVALGAAGYYLVELPALRARVPLLQCFVRHEKEHLAK